jgi:formylglycine-generating enzyme required for sulfatase activity
MVASAALSQQRAGRVALVIGNANYAGLRAPASTINDARALAAELRRKNFEVDLEENLGREKMQQVITAFMAKIAKGKTALLYFSGFGLQSVRQTYLIPVDAQIKTEQDVWDYFSVNDLLAEMHRRGADIKIMVIDAARKNPFESKFRQAPAGLAPIVAIDGTLAISSAAPGKLVEDSSAARSLFVNELIKEMAAPNRTAEEVFSRTRIAVSRASKNEQIPLVVSSLTDEFYFTAAASAPPPAQAARPAPPAPPPPAATPPAVARLTDRPQASPAATTAAAPSQPGSVFKDCEDCPELVVVPAGSFEMGSSASDYSKPVHRVTIGAPFAIGRYEVTFDQWEKCVEDRGCKNRPHDRGWGRGSHPVINVRWVDTKEYVAWMSKKTGHTYRLPTEAEWEYAARGGTTTPFWWGSAAGSAQANCRQCNTGHPERSVPVGSYKPNPFGLYDTAGNAAEWLEDCWNDNYRGAPADGSPWLKGECRMRVLRGGSFDSEPVNVQSSARFRYDTDVPYSANGFRILRELP